MSLASIPEEIAGSGIDCAVVCTNHSVFSYAAIAQGDDRGAKENAARELTRLRENAEKMGFDGRQLAQLTSNLAPAGLKADWMAITVLIGISLKPVPRRARRRAAR